jgi:glycosyltransferase involved in cell wall biosynthesis
MRGKSARKWKLAIIVTHPIQYYSPVFRALSLRESLDLRVFYTWSQAHSGDYADKGFGRNVKWDIPLLDGYAYEFVRNVAKTPDIEHFWGVRNPTMIGAIEAWAPDALLVYGWNLWTHLQVLVHFSGKLPILFRGDSTLLDRLPTIRSIARRILLRWVYGHVDVALAVGRNNHDYFKWCGLPSDRIVIAPHAIDIARFSDQNSGYTEQARAWRRELEIPEYAVAFLYAGKMQRKKDPLLLLNAFMHLDAKSHLVMVGTGELESKLHEMAENHPNIHFIPFQNQSLMPAVYRIGDLFVLPSCGPGETWGLALNEAMASSRAIAVSDKAGGAADLVKNGVNGWIFESGNLTALVEILRKSADLGRDRLHDVGAMGRRIISQWSPEESADRIGAAVLGLICSREN